MSIESMFMAPELMLQSPVGWNRLRSSRENQTRLHASFSRESPPDPASPQFVLRAFEHAIRHFPGSILHFRLTEEYLHNGQPPSSRVIGVHADGYPFFLMCNNNPTLVEINSAFVQLEPGELYFLHAQQLHAAPESSDSDCLRMRLKVCVDW